MTGWMNMRGLRCYSGGSGLPLRMEMLCLWKPWSEFLLDRFISSPVFEHWGRKIGSQFPFSVYSVDGFASYNSFQYFGSQDFIGCNRGGVPVQDNKIGQLAYDQRSFIFLGKFSIGGSLGIGVDGLFDGELLLGEIFLLSVLILAGHCSI